MDSAPVPEAPPRRSRLRRILIWTGASLAVLVLAVFFGAPPIIASVVRSRLQATLNDRIDGSATVGDVSFSWFGGAGIHNVEIKDRRGARVASVKSISAGLSLRAIFGGRIVAAVRVENPHLEIRTTDGRLNLTAILKPDPGAGAPETASRKPSGPPDLPPLDVTLTVSNVAIVVAGEKESFGFDASGEYRLTHEAGRVSLAGKTTAGDGSVTLSIDADLRGAASADVKIDRVPLDARLGPILELFHPVFAKARGQLDGAMDGSVALRHEKPFTATDDELLKGLGGRGRLEIRDCSFTGSQLLGELMAALSTAKREVKLKPVEFRIADGRIVYDQPWQWTISGSETTFTGSIGLDRTLDLVWRIPVTDELASRVPALKSSRGKTFQAPIKGTVTSPRLDLKGVVSQAAGDRLEEEAKKGIDDLLGGKDEKKAKKLLEEADQLYTAGKKAEAAEKYRKIKDDLDRTRVYKENKDRIKQRMNER